LPGVHVEVLVTTTDVVVVHDSSGAWPGHVVEEREVEVVIEELLLEPGAVRTKYAPTPAITTITTAITAMTVPATAGLLGMKVNSHQS
jgi:hypothetical protein